MSPLARPAEEAAVENFLRRARRRYLTRDFLAAVAVAAATSLTIEYGVVLADRHLGLEVPPFSSGLGLLALFGAAVLRRNRLGAVAARADTRLQLKDRLATFLDFSGRADIEHGFRRAQVREAAVALAAVDPVRGIRIPALLRAAPLLFVWMLYVDYFPYSVPFVPPVMEQVVRIADPRRGLFRRGQTVRSDSTRAPSAETPAPAPPGGTPASAGSPSTPTGQSPKGGLEQDRPAAGGGGVPRAGSVPGPASEPARLYSEPVTRGLTPVGADAPGSAGVEPSPIPEPPLRGRISFNLIPKDGESDGPAGAGTAPGGGTSRGLEITVDYDEIPPEYRPHVRRYFNVLVRLMQGGNDGT